MQFRAFEPHIEVNGQTVYAVLDAFSTWRAMPSEALLAVGIGVRGDDGIVAVDRDAWYPQQAWLDAFERIAEYVGRSALHAIGLKIPENALFPPNATDVPSAVASVDVAYHLNHRKHGAVMYDAVTGTMLEGIGHYGCEPVSERAVRSRCETPYPCEFDRGILTSVARRFAPAAHVHHEGGMCRESGSESCAYVIRW